jgi:hypothetical protein
MGYRSEVAIAVYGDIEVLNKYVEDTFGDEVRIHPNDELAYMFTNHTKVEEGVFLFHIDSVKWYDGYPAVDKFNKFVERCEDVGLCGERMIIGENFDDVQYSIHSKDESDECRYVLNINRTIEINI